MQALSSSHCIASRRPFAAAGAAAKRAARPVAAMAGLSSQTSNPFAEELQQTAKYIAQRGRGILASDESNATTGARRRRMFACRGSPPCVAWLTLPRPAAGKRLESVGVENTEDNRRDWRQLLYTAPGAYEGHQGVCVRGLLCHCVPNAAGVPWNPLPCRAAAPAWLSLQALASTSAGPSCLRRRCTRRLATVGGLAAVSGTALPCAPAQPTWHMSAEAVAACPSAGNPPPPAPAGPTQHLLCVCCPNTLSPALLSCLPAHPAAGTQFVDVLKEQGIVPGIKVDTGLQVGRGVGHAG